MFHQRTLNIGSAMLFHFLYFKKIGPEPFSLLFHFVLFELDHNVCLTMPTIKQFSSGKRLWKLTTTMAEHRPGVGLSLISLHIMILVYKTICYP